MTYRRYKKIPLIIIVILICGCKNNNGNHFGKQELTSELQSDSLTFNNQINKNKDTFYFDKLVDECLLTSDGQTTLGMIQCFDSAAVFLDSILSNTYDMLYTKLDSTDKKKLRESQENWQKFRISESEFLTSSFYTWANFSKYGHGREHSITQSAWKYDIVRERLINLIEYNEEIYIEEPN